MALYGPFNDEPAFVISPDLLYADDTIILGNDAHRVQAHFSILVDEGRKYGLELNAAKTIMMQVNHNSRICHTSGEAIKIVDEAVYLGGLITSTANARPELTRRLGEARSVFRKLRQCWNHANITLKRKVELYQSIVLPKLLYNLESLWLNQDGKCRLNAFHVKCLRQICRIAPSFISRVPNAEVYKLTGGILLSTLLETQQVKLYRSIVHMPENSVIRQFISEPNSVHPKVWDANRKRGRPKQQWVAGVFRMAMMQGVIW